MEQFPGTDEKIAKSRAFYRRENRTPLAGFFLGSEYPNLRYPAYRDLPTERYLRPEDFPVEPFLENCQELYLGHQRCGGELFWTATPFWGIPWIEAMLGFPLSYNRESWSITASNPEDRITVEDIPTFSPDNPWAKLYSRYVEALKSHSAGRYPLGSTRIRGLADILAVLFGGEDFAVTAISRPELIEEALSRLGPFYSAVMDFQAQQLPLFHEGLGSFYYYLWSPEDTLWHQEDSVMLLSPDIYRQLLLEKNRELYRQHRNNICHFHSTGGFIPFREIISLKPLAIEMHLDSGGPTARDLEERHREILETTPLIIWGSFTEDDLEQVLTRLPPEGLALNMVVDSVEEAKSIWERYFKFL